MKKLKEMSLKKSRFISISSSIISFLLSSSIIFKIGVPNVWTAIMFGLMISIGVYGILFVAIFEGPLKIVNQRHKNKLEKILKYDGYTEVQPYTNEYIDIALDEKVKYYAKIIENNQVEVMICKNQEVTYKYLDYYKFNKIFSI